MCPTPPAPPPSGFVCNDASPAEPVSFEGELRWCEPAPHHFCLLAGATSFPAFQGCVSEFGDPGGMCWCPAPPAPKPYPEDADGG